MIALQLSIHFRAIYCRSTKYTMHSEANSPRSGETRSYHDWCLVGSGHGLNRWTGHFLVVFLGFSVSMTSKHQHLIACIIASINFNRKHLFFSPPLFGTTFLRHKIANMCGIWSTVLSAERMDRVAQFGWFGCSVSIIPRRRQNIFAGKLSIYGFANWKMTNASTFRNKTNAFANTHAYSGLATRIYGTKCKVDWCSCILCAAIWHPCITATPFMDRITVAQVISTEYIVCEHRFGSNAQCVSPSRNGRQRIHRVRAYNANNSTLSALFWRSNVVDGVHWMPRSLNELISFAIQRGLFSAT